MEKKIICLDTNYLIRGLSPGTTESLALITWYQSGFSLIAPSLVWFEFLCGPIEEIHEQTIRNFLTGGIIAFEEVHAFKAAQLFNAFNRSRALRVDAMIAATAIAEGASLATNNHRDFQLFVSYGLQLL